MWLSLVFIKVTGWVAGALSKMKLRFSYFPVNFTKHIFHRTLQGNWFNCYLKHKIFEFSFPFSNLSDVYLLILVNFVVVFTHLPSDYDHTNTFWLLHSLHLFVYWSSCHLAFFFGSTGCCMREKKLENSSESYILGLGKTLINTILLSSPTKSLTQ